MGQTCYQDVSTKQTSSSLGFNVGSTAWSLPTEYVLDNCHKSFGFLAVFLRWEVQEGMKRKSKTRKQGNYVIDIWLKIGNDGVMDIWLKIGND